MKIKSVRSGKRCTTTRPDWESSIPKADGWVSSRHSGCSRYCCKNTTKMWPACRGIRPRPRALDPRQPNGSAMRLWHRLPWLLFGLVGAMLAAGVVDAFQNQLQREVLVAFFIPGVVYLADAVGTQTEALVIRGMSVGVGVRSIVWREAVTGVLIGALIAAAAYPATLLFWGVPAVSLAVALSLLAACSVAAAVAMVLPWLLSKFGVDPAFGSGPVATVVQDVLSILVYLSFSTAIVG